MGNLILLISITVVFLIIATILTVLLLKNMRNISEQSKHVAQQDDEEETCVYLPLDLKPSVLIAFKKACASSHTTHTKEVEKFIIKYINEHGNESLEK